MIKKRPEFLGHLCLQAQDEITFEMMLPWRKSCWSIFGVGVQGIKKSVHWCLCGFAVEASKVHMVPAAERALDLLDPWVAGRCEGLPVGVEIPSPRLTHRGAPPPPPPPPGFKPHAYPGSSPDRVPGSLAQPPSPAASSPSP